MSPAVHAGSIPAELLSHPALWRASEFPRTLRPGLPTGFDELDAALPGGGWPEGALTEILPAREGIGELRLFGPALARLSAAGRRLVWVAPPHRPYAPALTASGIELSRLAIVATRSSREALWAIEQTLASSACGAVLAWPDTVKYPELRRLQLAAEASRALAVLFRPQQAAARNPPLPHCASCWKLWPADCSRRTSSSAAALRLHTRCCCGPPRSPCAVRGPRAKTWQDGPPTQRPARSFTWRN